MRVPRRFWFPLLMMARLAGAWKATAPSKQRTHRQRSGPQTSRCVPFILSILSPSPSFLSLLSLSLSLPLFLSFILSVFLLPFPRRYLPLGFDTAQIGENQLKSTRLLSAQNEADIK